MRFDNAGRVGEVVWNMRLADLTRSADRAVLQRHFNGFPPFDETKAEENFNQVNINFLEGANLLSQARRQWNQAFLTGSRYFSVGLDSGPKHKRWGWGQELTKHANTPLKRSRKQTDLLRSLGANIMLYGIGPANWRDARSIVPDPLFVSSLMVPSETEIDFENLEWFAVFREYTPTQLYELTHGFRVDPGWNLPMVKEQLKQVATKYQKEPNATAFQYMPERIEELIKQDKGFWNTDAVPTIDVWDFYFREGEDGNGWYRRMVLDWGDTTRTKPDFKDGKNDKEYGGFLYTSGKRKYAKSLSEILHCQFGDCSAMAPFKYHSVRSLAWMLWGVCDLQNRMRCRFSESLFEQLMWFFRVANDRTGFDRIKKAMFTHMGVIPNNVQMVGPNDRFKPDAALMQMGFAMNRQLMSENSASFTQQLDPGQQKEMTATETMARVNAVNALVSGMLNLAYVYAEPFYREQCRRLCLPNPTDAMAREFRKRCLQAGVPEEMLDVERWTIEPVRIVGGGDKTLQMATIQFLNSIRKNMGPQGQRLIDNMSVFAATDQPELAAEIAPTDETKDVSNSTHDAQLATERLMRGLPFEEAADMVYEDYVVQWLKDMAMIVQQLQQVGGMATKEQILGLGNMAAHVGKFLQIMASDDESKPKVKQYQDTLGQLTNFIKAFAQRLQQQQGAGNNGNGAEDAKTAATLRGKMMIDAAKAENLRESHALRTAQRQVTFESEEARKDREHAAKLRREAEQALVQSATTPIRGLQE